MRLRIPARRLVLAVTALCAVAAIAMTALVLRPAPSEPVAQAEGPYGAGSGDGAHVLVLGDSWTYGQAATQREHGYAYRLAAIGGWQVTVAGEPASGYLRAGVGGRTYGERIDLLDPALEPELIVVQGSINDRRLGADGYRSAVVDAWDALADRFPDAQILVLGPRTAGASRMWRVATPTCAQESQHGGVVSRWGSTTRVRSAQNAPRTPNCKLNN